MARPRGLDYFIVATIAALILGGIAIRPILLVAIHKITSAPPPVF